ncbi:MAG: hypothetical protein AB1705_08530 [Verrucomicrobiota bacterium]
MNGLNRRWARGVLLVALFTAVAGLFTLDLLALAEGPQVGVAQPIDPAAAGPEASAPGWVLELVTKLPWLSTVLLVIGVLRVAVKPAMALFYTIVKATPTDWDDKLYERVESSKVYKAICFALDWLASVKLVHPKTK